MIKYSEGYNPIIEYWEWINKNKVNKNRTSTKVKKVYKELVRVINDPLSIWEYDYIKGNHAIEFIENYCRHSKGSLWRKTFYIRIMAKGFSSCYFWNGS